MKKFTKAIVAALFCILGVSLISCGDPDESKSEDLDLHFTYNAEKSGNGKKVFTSQKVESIKEDFITIDVIINMTFEPQGEDAGEYLMETFVDYTFDDAKMKKALKKQYAKLGQNLTDDEVEQYMAISKSMIVDSTVYVLKGDYNMSLIEGDDYKVVLDVRQHYEPKEDLDESDLSGYLSTGIYPGEWKNVNPIIENWKTFTLTVNEQTGPSGFDMFISEKDPVAKYFNTDDLAEVPDL